MINKEIANINFNTFAENLFPYFLRLADFDVLDGDLKIGDGTEQELFALLRNYCNFYQFPTLKIGIDRYRKAPIDKLIIRSLINKGLSEDNYNLETLDILTMDDLNDDGKKNNELLKFLQQYKMIINIEATR